MKNKQDTAIVIVLFALLLGWMWFENKRGAERARAQQEARAIAQASAQPGSAPAQASLEAAPGSPTNAVVQPPADAAPATAPEAEAAPLPRLPEQNVTLTTAELALRVSSRGGTILSATLPLYHVQPDVTSGPVVLDFQSRPVLALEGLPGLPADADYRVVEGQDGATTVALSAESRQGLLVERRIEVLDTYRVVVTDRMRNTSASALSVPTNWVGLGVIQRGASKNEIVGADSLAAGAKQKVLHWETKLVGMLTGRTGGMGCGGAGAPIHASVTTPVAGAQEWVALKSRFFAQSFSSSTTNAGFRLQVDASTQPGLLPVARVSGAVAFPGFALQPGEGVERAYTLYIGPKKLAYLRKLGHRSNEIMEFGFFRWFCEPLVPTLNFFHRLIPNYGVAVILLTLLVRIVFWPLTHKSTESMKRMQALQPKLKALQVEFKDNAQKLQQETWKLYRENKVNPMSSCLPMLVQIPVFIALYTVLRSAVELRFAPFLWIVDLSEPENLFAGLLPGGFALNILPVLMAVTMGLQTYFTPSVGDPAQQKMMMYLMPGMMLFMFYSMPSALSLYWTFSQGVSIAQLWWQRRSSDVALAPAGGPPDDPEQGMTRQMRRRVGRE